MANNKTINIAINELPEHMPTRHSVVAKSVGKFFWYLSGWRFAGILPNEKKMMIAAAPHTSNWDFFIALPIILALSIKASIMMKKEAFFWPVAKLWRWFGFIPIDRSGARGVVGSVIEHFESNEQLWFVITPEGTRKKVEQWKTGFLSIAHEADVPILLVSWDYPTKTIHFGRVIRASGDHQKDLADIREYYRQFTGKRPENH